jgi:hypothetical protein
VIEQVGTGWDIVLWNWNKTSNQWHPF